MRYMWPSESSPSRSLSIADTGSWLRHGGWQEDILAGAQVAGTGLRSSTSKLALCTRGTVVLGSRERQGTQHARPLLYDGSRPAVRCKAAAAILFALVIGPTTGVVVPPFW